jgi:hypothetical protein
MSRPNKKPVKSIAIPALRESSAGEKIIQMPRRTNPELKINEEYLKIQLDICINISVNLYMSQMSYMVNDQFANF